MTHLRLKPEVTPTAEQIEAAEGSPLLAQLLLQRGIDTPDAIRRFIQLDAYQPTGIEALPDWEKSLARLRQAIDNNESILIYGDFDVDGVTGTSILYQCLKLQLNANVTYYIPSRHREGHGLNTASLCRLISSRKVKLVITTDTGITNFNEVNLLHQFNVDCIITDHHDLPVELPPALGILNPKVLEPEHPLYMMSGAGVAFKVCEALLENYGHPPDRVESLVDLAAVGTVVDLVPLIDENRYLVWRGLKQLNLGQRLGIKALLEQANVSDQAQLTSTSLAFVIGPRLNAIGRLSEAGDAVELLVSDDLEQVTTLAAQIEQLNRQRKTLVDKAVQQAKGYLVQTGALTDTSGIIVCSPDWNEGIIGLVASELVNQFQRPAFVGRVSEETNQIKFSARSIEQFDLHANLTLIEDMFDKWGGHAGAAGFSIPIDKLDELKRRLLEVCHRSLAQMDTTPVITVDLKLTAPQITEGLLHLQDQLEPTGMSNPLPVFLMDDFDLGDFRRIGEDKRHIQLTVQGKQAGHYLKALYWNWGADVTLPEKNSIKTLCFTVQRNEYQGKTTPQLILKHLDLGKTPLKMATPMSVATKPSALIDSDTEPVTFTKSLVSTHEQTTEQGHWMDHRAHPSWDVLFGQMMSSVNQANDTSSGNQSQWLIYCQGSQHFLPFPMLGDYVIQSLQDMSEPEENTQLILWDLPPHHGALTQLIEGLSPNVVHLVGGKYRQIPLIRSEGTYLEGLWRLLLKASQANEGVVSLQTLMTGLSTTDSVILAGLVCLEAITSVSFSLELADEDDFYIEMSDYKNCSAKLDPARIESIVSSPSWNLYKQTLGQVHQYRQWLMTAKLSVIESMSSCETVGSTLLAPLSASDALSDAPKPTNISISSV